MLWLITLFCCCRVKQKTSPEKCMEYIHKSLTDICHESGFEGLQYYGGPEVMCYECNKMIILSCMEYGKATLDLYPTCGTCDDEEYDVKKIMVS